MKKLMCFALVAVSAIAASASTVSWNINKVAYTTAQTTASNYTAYLLDAAAFTSKDLAVASILGGDTTTGVVATQSGQNVAGTPATIKFQGMQQKMPSAWDETTKMDFYAILVDGTVGEKGTVKNYMVTANSGEKTKSAAGLFTVSLGSQAENSWTSTEPEPTPEPTSALLMLLGVAGLALRRKQK